LIAAQVAGALEAAHKAGIIHRDVKPSNILLDENGDAKLLDMGLARFKQESFEQTFTSSELSKFGMPMGTVAYMAPEQAINASDAGAPADIYALGCTLHHLVTGKPPFDNPSPIQVIVDHREKSIDGQSLSDRWMIPQTLVQTMERMMAKAPADRFESMADVRAALLPLADANYKPTLPSPTASAIGDRARMGQKKSLEKTGAASSKPWALWIAGLLMLAGLGVAGWFLFDSSGSAVTDNQDQATVVKWCLNEGALITVESEMGVQQIEDVQSVPDGDFKLTGISFADLLGQKVPLKLFSPAIPLKSISLIDAQLSNEVMDAISVHPTLHDIDFYRCEINCAPAVWSRLTNIARLEAEDCDLKNEVLPPISQLVNVKEILLPDNSINDTHLRSLGKLQELENLSLSGNPISPAVVLSLVGQLESLTFLDVGKIDFRPEDAKTLISQTKLEYLAMNYSAIGDDVVAELAKSELLENLDLDGTEITDRAINHLAKMKRLSLLDLSNTAVSDDALQSLRKMKKLTYLSLNNTDLTDRSAKDWAALTALEDLELDGTLITDKTVDQLAKLNLFSLSIIECDVSAQAVDDFLDQNPGCVIYLEP
jgi:hypothetical protein